MINVTLSWVAEKVGGQLFGQDQAIESVSTDTRSIAEADLFIALVGVNFDAHDFIHLAEEKKAAALIVSKQVDTSLPYILVEDTKLALGKLGAAVKVEVAPKTVAVTGSAGKTTVKEMVTAILARKHSVLSTNGNFNNDIGVPLTLLRLTHAHEYAVIELGANHLGEIAYTTSLTKPDVATVVNAAAAHLEGFGSLFGVARAKCEIFKGLDKDGVAILNKDSQFYDFWYGKVDHLKNYSFSVEEGADFSANDVTLGLDGRAEFQMRTPQGSTDVHLSLPGEHNVSNALVAAALAMQVGASLEDVKLGLQEMAQVAGRLNVKMLTNQVKLIDDTYNASVSSVNAAIDLLSSFSGRKVLVLGDMAELGEKARYYHEQVGEYAKQKGVDNLMSLGVLSQSASDCYEDKGKHFSDIDELVGTLTEWLSFEQRDITILVKGSRSARMERVVKALEESPVGKFERQRERIAC